MNTAVVIKFSIQYSYLYSTLFSTAADRRAQFEKLEYTEEDYQKELEHIEQVKLLPNQNDHSSLLNVWNYKHVLLNPFFRFHLVVFAKCLTFYLVLTMISRRKHAKQKIFTKNVKKVFVVKR